MTYNATCVFAFSTPTSGLFCSLGHLTVQMLGHISCYESYQRAKAAVLNEKCILYHECCSFPEKTEMCVVGQDHDQYFVREVLHRSFSSLPPQVMRTPHNLSICPRFPVRHRVLRNTLVRIRLVSGVTRMEACCRCGSARPVSTIRSYRACC